MIKTHMVRVRPNAFGGETTTSVCGRLRTVSDGMNLTDVRKEVTCLFCIKHLKLDDARRREDNRMHRIGFRCTKTRCTRCGTAGRP